MFHLQIIQFRQIIQQYLLLHHGSQIAPQGRLIPAVDEALASLGHLYQIDVTVTAPITSSVQRELPLKLSIIAQDQPNRSSSTPIPQISIWGVMAGSGSPDADRTLRPLFIEVDNVETKSFDGMLRGILGLLGPGRSNARLAPQVTDELPIAA